MSGGAGGRLVVGLALALWACAASAAQGYKIFYIGNSLTDQLYGAHEVAVGAGYTGCGWTKYSIAGVGIAQCWASAGENVVWMDSSQGYAIAGEGVTSVLQNYTWDVLVMQLFAYNGDNARTMIEGGGNFAELAYRKNPNCQVYVFGSYSDIYGIFDTLKGDPGVVNELFDQQARDAANGLRARFPNRKPALVVPVSLAMTATAAKIGGYSRLYRDPIHATREGRYVQVMTLFATVYRHDPHGALTSGLYYRDDNPWGVPDSFALVAQDAAWEVVQAHPLAGLHTTAAERPGRAPQARPAVPTISECTVCHDLIGRLAPQLSPGRGLRIAVVPGQTPRPLVVVR